MTKSELIAKVDSVINDTTASLQLVFDSLNKGQRTKLLKDKRIIEIFDRYNVVYREES